MKLKFCGAARQVTGSMHLVELENGYRILIDCGLDYEQQKEFHYNPEVQFPFEPSEIDVVILTHAHVDHSGNIPTLIKQGFGGKILCTPPTAELTGFLLLDSLKIMEMEQKRKQQSRGGRKRSAPKKSLYGYKHFSEAMERFVTLNFYQDFALRSDVKIKFIEAGHILGAASVYLTITEKEKEYKLGFTGDLGNYNSKLMKDPSPLIGVDYLVTESTYGGRFHKSVRTPEDELLHYIQSTCIDQPGRLVIPAFSVGRTQAIIFALHKLKEQGRLPNLKYFVDSPLAIRTTHVYSKYREYLNDETRKFIAKHKALFEFDEITYITDKEASENLQNHYDPCVIISAAGMVEGGRIQEHVRNNIRNSYCTILIAGFCAEGTLGHRLLQGQNYVTINGKEFPVYAKVAITDAFSAHPDQKGLLQYIEAAGGTSLKHLFLVHGEEEAMQQLQQTLNEIGCKNVSMPYKTETFELK